MENKKLKLRGWLPMLKKKIFDRIKNKYPLVRLNTNYRKRMRRFFKRQLGLRKVINLGNPKHLPKQITEGLNFKEIKTISNKNLEQKFNWFILKKKNLFKQKKKKFNKKIFIPEKLNFSNFKPIKSIIKFKPKAVGYIYPEDRASAKCDRHINWVRRNKFFRQERLKNYLELRQERLARRREARLLLLRRGKKMSLKIKKKKMKKEIKRNIRRGGQLSKFRGQFFKKLLTVIGMKQNFHYYLQVFKTKLGLNKITIFIFALKVKNLTANVISKIFAVNLAKTQKIYLAKKRTMLEIKKMKISFKKKNIAFYKLFGYRVLCNGRFNRKRKKSKFIFTYGRLPLNTYAANIDFSLEIAILRFGVCGIKTWLFNDTKRFYPSEKNILLGSHIVY